MSTIRPALTCAIEGCEKPSWARGWCQAHYTRWKRHGDPLAGRTHVKGRRCQNHPYRSSRGHGLCGSCLRRYRLERTSKRCTAHPDMPAYARNLCNPCYQSEQRIKSAYGITADEYRQIMASPCGICGGTAEVVDHCHSTGRVRGGLCTRCNVGLGVIEGWYTERRAEIDAWLSSDIHAKARRVCR